MKDLTQKQKQILDYISEFSKKEGMAPTIYEISSHFDIKSPTAFAHVRALQRKGCLNRSSKARSIALAGNAKPRYFSMNLSIPVLGRISAGVTSDSPEQVEGHILLDSMLVPPGGNREDMFGLIVQGESMRDLGILDGDIAIISKKFNFRNGDIVVAMVDGDTTIKSLYRHDDMWELRPANSDFKPRYVPFDQLSVQGVMVGLQRQYR